MHRSMSSWSTPAMPNALAPDWRAAVVSRSGWPISWWATASPQPSSSTGAFGRSRARSADVTTTAPPPSLMMQQSSRCSGSEIMRLASTSSTVIGWRILAAGLSDAWWRMVTAISASCSEVVPKRCWWSWATRA